MHWNCESCGACCVGLRVGATALVNTELKKKRLPLLTAHDQEMPRKDEACVALGGVVGTASAKCQIYAGRPQVCADFRPGSAQCVEMRVAHGIDTVPDPIGWWMGRGSRAPAQLFEALRRYYLNLPALGGIIRAKRLESWILEAARRDADENERRMEQQGARRLALRAYEDGEKFAVVEARPKPRRARKTKRR